MIKILTTIFILIYGFTFGQEFSYPKINKQGKDINNFIPDGWLLLDSTRGDLNKDNHNDLVLITQHKDSVLVINKNLEYIDSVITQPRVLIILFYNQRTNQYHLVEQSKSFILNHNNANMDDPYQDISIEKGILKIEFHIFMNMGGWDMSNNFYKFRYQNNDFVLIGADYNYINRGSGETEDRSYNFLNKKIKVTIGTIESEKQQISWRTINLKKFKTIKTFKQPFTWQVEKDYYL